MLVPEVIPQLRSSSSWNWSHIVHLGNSRHNCCCMNCQVFLVFIAGTSWTEAARVISLCLFNDETSNHHRCFPYWKSATAVCIFVTAADCIWCIWVRLVTRLDHKFAFQFVWCSLDCCWVFRIALCKVNSHSCDVAHVCMSLLWMHQLCDSISWGCICPNFALRSCL